jgi:hypothetical protein
VLHFTPHLQVSASGMPSRLPARRPARRKGEPRALEQHRGEGMGLLLPRRISPHFLAAVSAAGRRAGEQESRQPTCVAATTETLMKLIVTGLIIIYEISRITRPFRGGVLGMMPVEQCLLMCFVCSCAGRMRHEPAGLGSGFRLSVLQGKHGLDLGLPALLEHGMKRELCQDVTSMPLPDGVVHTPFHAIVVMGRSVAGIDALPEPGRAGQSWAGRRSASFHSSSVGVSIRKAFEAACEETRTAEGGAEGAGAARWRGDGFTPSSPRVSSLSGSSISCRPTCGGTRIGAVDLPGLRPRRLW